MDYLGVVKVGIITTLSFLLALGVTPLLTKFLYKYKMGKNIRDESANTPIFTKLHAKKAGTPTMGGIMIWGSVLAVILGISLLGSVFDIAFFKYLDFLSRSQTWLPLGAMIACAVVGLVDDYMNVRKIGPNGGGVSMGHKLIIYFFIALVGALWFYFKLDWDVLHIPFIGSYPIGIWYIPIFIFIVASTVFSVNEIDGLDGLAGGSLLYAFLAFGVIAFMQGRVDLAALCGAIVGALLAFLWFNIPPARFFMGDTGSMALGVTLGIVVMLTNTVFFLPIIGILFVIESLSVIIQLTSKKLRNGKKVFHSAPIHHHFEALGWPEAKIVMRFWVIATISAIVGLVAAIADMQLF
jgi:phospho-N-acetylmuramoyl-pentapeptide-transferase